MTIKQIIIATCFWLVLFPAQAQVLYSGQADPNALTTVPANSVGVDHSWYLDFLTGNVYGPKESGQWPSSPATILSLAATGGVPVTSLGAKCDAQVSYTYITLSPGNGGQRSMITSAPMTKADVGKTILLSIGTISTNGPWVGTIAAVTPGSPYSTVTLNGPAGFDDSISTYAITNWGHDDTTAISNAITTYQGIRPIIIPALCGISSTLSLTAPSAQILGTTPPFGYHNGPTPFTPTPSSGFVWLGGANTMFQQVTPNGANNLQTRGQKVANLSFYGGASASVGRLISTVANSVADSLYVTDIATNGYNYLYGSGGATNLYEVASTCYLSEKNLVASTVLSASTGSIGMLLTGNTTSQVQGVTTPWNTCESNFENITVLFGATDAIQCSLADHNHFLNVNFIGNGANTGSYSLHLSSINSTYYCQSNVFKKVSVNLGNGGTNLMGLIRSEAQAQGNTIEQLDNYSPPSGWLPSVVSGSLLTCTWDNGGQCVTYTVATLPTCSGTFQTNTKGKPLLVSDANSTVYNAIAAGGGTNVMPVVCDGTNWRLH